MTTLRYIKGFVLEPFLGIFVVPVLILFFMDYSPVWNKAYPLNVILTIPGILLLLVGLVLVSITTYHFAKYGEGSAAPWDPPVNLVETILFTSIPLLLLFLFLWIGNHVLFVKVEEPELTKKFGDKYASYMKNVPRWIPRRSAWLPSSED